MKKHDTFYGLLLLIFMTSCDISYFDNEIGDMQWNGQVTAPIGEITYTISELFEELDVDDIDEDSEGNLSFSYTKSISGGSNANYDVAIEDTFLSREINSPLTSELFTDAGVTSPYTIVDAEILPGIPNPFITTQTVQKQITHDFLLSQALTEASFNGGSLVLDISSNLSKDILVNINIPSLVRKIDNTPYVTTQTITSAGFQIVIPLEEYTINFTHDGTTFDQTTNYLVVNLEAEFDFQIGDIVKDNDRVFYELTIENASTEVIYGDFQQEPFELTSQSVFLDFFNNFGEGAIAFDNPIMRLTISNGYGFPVGINLSNIEAKNETNAINLSYTGNELLENTIIIEGLETYLPTAGPVITEKIIDKTNSNFSNLLSLKPTEIVLDVFGTANPIDNDPNLNFFAPINEAFNADVEIEVPLNVTFDNIEVSKKVVFNNTEDLQEIESITLFLNTKNSIPITGNLELVFLNNGVDVNVSKSIVAFDAANVDSEGNSTGDKETSITLEFTGADIEKIKSATDIDVRFTLNTPTGGSPVNLSGKDKLTVMISTKMHVMLSE